VLVDSCSLSQYSCHRILRFYFSDVLRHRSTPPMIDQAMRVRSSYFPELNGSLRSRIFTVVSRRSRYRLPSDCNSVPIDPFAVVLIQLIADFHNCSFVVDRLHLFIVFIDSISFEAFALSYSL
jgi:hypothetical protein